MHTSTTFALELYPIHVTRCHIITFFSFPHSLIMHTVTVTMVKEVYYKLYSTIKMLDVCIICAFFRVYECVCLGIELFLKMYEQEKEEGE